MSIKCQKVDNKSVSIIVLQDMRLQEIWHAIAEIWLMSIIHLF